MADDAVAKSITPTHRCPIYGKARDALRGTVEDTTAALHRRLEPACADALKVELGGNTEMMYTYSLGPGDLRRCDDSVFL